MAYGSSASQSSTYPHPANTVASKAVDGNTDGNIHSGSTTHTREEQSPWWMVDLGRTYQISAITLWNRIDCCSARLQNFQIILSDERGTRVKTIPYSTGVKAILPFSVSPPTSARNVKVQVLGMGVLQMAEVQVFTSKNCVCVSVLVCVCVCFNT